MKTKINWLLVTILMANVAIFCVGIYLVHSLGVKYDGSKPVNWDQPKDTIIFDSLHSELKPVGSAE